MYGSIIWPNTVIDIAGPFYYCPAATAVLKMAPLNF